MDAVGWRIGRVPLPSAIATILSAKEWVDDEGRFRFDVAMATPVRAIDDGGLRRAAEACRKIIPRPSWYMGPIVKYQGWLLEAPDPGP